MSTYFTDFYPLEDVAGVAGSAQNPLATRSIDMKLYKWADTLPDTHLPSGVSVITWESSSFTLPGDNKFLLYKGGSLIASGITYSVDHLTLNGLTISVGTDGSIRLNGDQWTSDSETFNITATYLAADYILPITIRKSKVGSATVYSELLNATETVTAAADGTGYELPTANQIKLYKEGAQLTSGVTYSGGGTSNGLTVAVDSATGIITVYGEEWTGTTESFTITATYLGTPYNTTYTIRKSLTGSTDVKYELKYSTLTALASADGTEYNIPHSNNGWQLEPSSLPTGKNLYRAVLVGSTNSIDTTSSVDWSALEIEFTTTVSDSAITAELTNPIHLFPSSRLTTGNFEVTDYDDSGTEIHVYEGIEELVYDGVGTDVGTWTVEIEENLNVTAGLITLSEDLKSATLADYTDMVTSTLTYTYVKFLITGTTTTGKAFSTFKSQLLRRGNGSYAYKLQTSAPVITKLSPGATVNGTHSSIQITGYRKEDELEERWGWLTITPFGGSRGAAVDVAAYALANPGSPNITLAPISSSTVTSYLLQLWSNDPDNIPVGESAVVKDYTNIPVVYKGASGINITLSNEAFQFYADPDGYVTTYTGSGTNVTVKEGSEDLIFNADSASYPATNGTWNIYRIVSGVASASAITGGSTSTAVVPAVTAVTFSNDTPYIDFYIYGKSKIGEAFFVIKRQTFTKLKEPRAYSIELSADTITKASPDAATDGTYSSIVISGYRFDGTDTIATSGTRYGYITYTPNNGTESARVDVSTSGYTLTPASSSDVSSYTIKLYAAASGGSALYTKVVNVVFKGAPGVDGTPGIDGITASLSNPAHNFRADSTGAVLSYTNSGTTIKVIQGITEFSFNSVVTTATYPSTVGKYNLKIDGTYITPSTSITGTTLCTVGDHTSAFANQDNLKVDYTFYIKTLEGNNITFVLTQTFSKTKTPILYDLVLSSSVIYKDAIDATTDGTYSSITISATKLDGDTLTNPYGYVTYQANNGTESSRFNLTSVGVNPVVLAPTSTSDAASYTVRLYTAASGGSAVVTKTVYVVFKGSTGSTGTPGINAKTLNLSTTRQIFTFDGTGALSPSPQSAVFTPNAQNLSNALDWAYTDNLSTASLTSYFTGTTDKTMSSTIFSDNSARKWVKVTVSGTGTESSYSDSITVNRVDDGSEVLTATLSNDMQPIPTDKDGNGGVLTGVAEGQMTVFYGSTDVTSACTFSEVSEVGGTGVINNSVGSPIASKPKGYYRADTLTADVFNYTVRATYNPGSGNISVDKVFSVVKQKQGVTGSTGSPGSNGSNGQRIAFITLYQWGSSTAPTSFPTTAVFSYTWSTGVPTLTSGTLGSWSLNIGTGTSGQKLWRIAQAISNNTTETTTTGISWTSTDVFSIGAQGSDGLRGSRTFYRSIAGSVWSSTEANTAITSAGLSPVTLDIVTLYNSGSGYSETKYYNGGTPTSDTGWTSVAQVIDGNLLVTGSVAAQALKIDNATITASGNTLVVGSLNASQITTGTLNSSLTYTGSLNVSGTAKIAGTAANTLGLGSAVLEVGGAAVANLGIVSLTTDYSIFAQTASTNSGKSAIAAVSTNAAYALRAYTTSTGKGAYISGSTGLEVEGTTNNPAINATGFVQSNAVIRSTGSESFLDANIGTYGGNATEMYFSSLEGYVRAFTRHATTPVHKPLNLQGSSVKIGTGTGSTATTVVTVSTTTVTTTVPVLVSDGSASAPSLSFSAETNLGFYRAGTQSLNCVVNGTMVTQFNSAGTYFAKHPRLAASPPATSADTGSAGQVAVDANYIYVCTATNTWKRAALSTW